MLNKEELIMEIKKPHIVIIGAGFGGIKIARLLAKENVDITLIDQHNFHLFQPLLYHVSTSILAEDEIAYPIRAFFRKNMKISRRTVMKYREQMGYPSSVKRKRY